jgi:hypothetical protein
MEGLNDQEDDSINDNVDDNSDICCLMRMIILILKMRIVMMKTIGITYSKSNFQKLKRDDPSITDIHIELNCKFFQ